MLNTIGKVLLGLVLLAVVVLAAWYQIDGQPLPEAAGFLQGEGYTAAQGEDGSYVFTPAAPNGRGIVLMHGALIKPLSYARSAAYFARQGYLVFLPYGGGSRLSITAVDRAAARLDSFGVKDWFLIGHSMGGFSSLELLTRRPKGIRAVALWASAMPGDYSKLGVPMLFLRGDHDGLLPPERFADARSKLPPATQYVNVPGGNHRSFALYSHQFFDGEATLTPAQQIDIADGETASFFIRVAAGAP
jgi:pimeloyl-ACP methyl ester carboxylesterase